MGNVQEGYSGNSLKARIARVQRRCCVPSSRNKFQNWTRSFLSSAKLQLVWKGWEDKRVMGLWIMCLGKLKV